MRRTLGLAGLLLTGAAHAADVDDLTAALRQARTLAARGTAEVSVFFPPRAVPTRTAATLPAVPFRPALLAAHFTVTRADAPPVAGRDVTRFDLVPKVGQAARWTLWVDRAWNIPLAYEERMPDGTLARRATFTQVQPQAVKVKRGVPAIPAGLRPAVLAALPGLRLPPGFVPTGVKVRPAGGLEVTLSDGANVLALVLAPRNVRAAPGVASRRVGDGFVWLVGNLPAAPLRSALAGIKSVDLAGLGTFLAPAASNP
ncbi:sigma E regulatory protein MucB/RseB [Deinococcus phoenicis]|uniref:Sigma E regulatory protein MucB/RseB n=1 Tax=Deinococcus phoenicis TaxID=1476583 RepID=A0A016QSK8_9DEIO|nr:transcriptional regulator [Deinococcus phoenicis]EYB68986.1 sigma E regulatory protein MucB/RseB [Deinococcus phoenicis]